MENTESITRRGFMGTMGAMGAMGAALANAGIALADNAAVGIPADKALGTAEQITDPALEVLGRSTMSLDELNRRRQELVDSKTEDYVCADGTVIPNVYVKLRTLVNTYGIGMGNDLTDMCFGFWMRFFNEDEAQAYLEMPKGVFFNALDFAAESGRPVEECAELLETLAMRGVMFRAVHAGQKVYRQIPFLQGSCEYSMPDVATDPRGYLMNMGTATTDTGDRFMYSGTSFYRAIPCDRSIVTDGEIHPYDDWEAIINSKENFALAACYCKTCAAYGAGQDVPDFCTPEISEATLDACGHPLETCLVLGDEADYFVETGVARPITKEEALAVIRNNAKAGFMIESYYSKTSEVICSCHVDCCGHLKFHKALPAEMYAESNLRPHVSHYELNYDKDACIQCGACVERCPMQCITLDDEGYPQVDAHCFRCGQCGMTCPAGARTLSAKPQDEWGFLPYSILDDDNNKAAWRFEHGLIW